MQSTSLSPGASGRSGRAFGLAGPAGRPPAGLAVGWRTLECLGVGVALFIQTGAISVLAFGVANGGLTASARSALQLFSVPGYLITLFLLARRPGQLLAAVRRNVWVALLLGMTVVSTVWSIAPSTSLRRSIGLVLPTLLAYLIATRFTPRQFLVLIVLLLGACMGLSLVFAVALPGWAMMPEGDALRGVWNHKNVLGWNAAIATLAAGALLMDRGAGLRRTAVLVLVASVACLLLSRSTTGLVTAASAGLFALIYWLLARIRGAGRIVLVLVALQVAALAVLSMDLLLGILAEGTDKDASLTGRVPLWAVVDQAIARRPLFGYGYQAFWTPGSGEAWAIWTRVGWMAPHAHNGIRDTLLSLGLVGTVLLLVVILRALRDGALLHCRYPKKSWLWINVLICVTLVMNLTESTLLAQNSFQFTIFMTAVLMISMGQPDR